MSSDAVPTSEPQGKPISIAQLETVNFSQLLSQEPPELSKLLKSCKTHGFFYLDLQGLDTRHILDDELSMYRVMEEYFSQPLEVKMKDDRASMTHGYKPPGTFAGVIWESKDCYETLKVSRDEMAALSAALPDATKNERKLFDSFISSSNIITKVILSSLSTAAGLEGLARYETSHRNSVPSNTTLVLLHYPKQSVHDVNVGHNKHTDIGTLTLLFSKQWGLQVLSPDTHAWEFVEPRPGHAIINVGDSLKFLSSNSLHSCIHRVLPVGGTQTEDRYSIAYFLRPESEQRFMDSEGRDVTAREWHDGKYKTFADTHEKQAMNSILTGGMEKL